MAFEHKGMTGLGYALSESLASTSVVGLIPNDTSTATAIANAVLIQAALDRSGYVHVRGAPGNYSISVANIAAASQILTIGSETDLEISHGINLLGPGVSVSSALPLLANKNWRSNKLTITSITSAVTAAPYVVTVTVRITGHPFKVGQYLQVKGCTGGSQVYNDVWRVATVGLPTVNDLTFTAYGYSAAPAAGAGTMIAYPADANFRVRGGGSFDAMRNTNASGFLGELGKMASIFNKCSDYSVLVPFKGGAKYGVYFCNTFRAIFNAGHAQAPSNALQGGGPFAQVYIGQSAVTEGDDIVALLTNNTGYEFYALRDSDNASYALCTQNSDGEVSDVTVENQDIGACSSRTITLSAGTAGAIKRVKIRNTRKKNSLAGLYMVVETPPGETGSYEDIEIDSMGGPYALNTPAIFIGTQSGATGIYKNFLFKNFYSRGGSVDGTSSVGFTKNVIEFGQSAGTVDGFTIEGADVDFDLANATAGCSLISWGAGSGIVTMRGLKINKCNFTSTGAVRGLTILSINSNAAGSEPIQLSNVTCSGYYSSLTNDGSTQSGTTFIQAENCHFGKGSSPNGQAIAVSTGGRSMTLMLTNVSHDSAVSGVLQVYGGSGKTFNVFWNNLKTSNKFFDFAGSTSHTINVHLANAASDNFSPASGALVNSFGTTCTWNFFGNCLDIGVDLSAIARNSGTVIFNTNAALGTLGAAGPVVGQGTAANSWRLMGDPTLRY